MYFSDHRFTSVGDDVGRSNPSPKQFPIGCLTRRKLERKFNQTKPRLQDLSVSSCVCQSFRFNCVMAAAAVCADVLRSAKQD